MLKVEHAVDGDDTLQQEVDREVAYLMRAQPKKSSSRSSPTGVPARYAGRRGAGGQSHTVRRFVLPSEGDVTLDEIDKPQSHDVIRSGVLSDKGKRQSEALKILSDARCTLLGGG